VKHLTYRITKYPSTTRLSKKDVDETTATAFNLWQDASFLTFEQSPTGKVDIEISFERDEHGDGIPFDGPGGVLAHAFYPSYGGGIHIDDTEFWTIDSSEGTNLLQAITHQLGHSLGLSHSDVRSAIMAPFNRDWDPNLKLDKDDVKAIQALYGETAESDNKSDNNDLENEALCSSGKLDTIVTMNNSETYAFLGDNYWKLTDTSVALGYPRSTSADWDGLPGNLDASFTWTNGRTYFFRGTMYWRFSEIGKMDAGYPKQLDEGFPGIPSNVDAAFVWPIDDQIYFLKGSNYWKFATDKKPHIDSSYPRPLSNWDGIPENPDSALQYSNGRTYFFKNGHYYRFDDNNFTLDASANPPFPRETGFWWFGCPENSSSLDVIDKTENNLR